MLRWFGGGELRRVANRLNAENEELREALQAREERIDKLMRLVAALRDVNAELDADRAKETANASA